MGRIEKLVVIAVLLVAALILAFALNRGGDEVQASDPMKSAERLLVRDGAWTPGAGDGDGGMPVIDPSPQNLSRAPEQGKPSLFLQAGPDVVPVPEVAPSEPKDSLSSGPVIDPTLPILVEEGGLRPSFLADYRVYSVIQGDTWSGLALRFFGDERYTRNLRLANDDLKELAPGSDILVPAYDFTAEEAGLTPMSGVVPVSATGVSAVTMGTPTATGRVEASALPKGSKPLEYEVRDGDTLSGISLAVFGTATRWKELLEANREKLQRPESLQVGMKLKVPEGGKLPPPAKNDQETKKKPEPKASTATTTASKKKVL